MLKGRVRMNIEYEKQMGNNIRRLRMYYELTQEQLSAKLQTKGIDITRSALAKIEVGQLSLIHISEPTRP